MTTMVTLMAGISQNIGRMNNIKNHDVIWSTNDRTNIERLFFLIL